MHILPLFLFSLWRTQQGPGERTTRTVDRTHASYGLLSFPPRRRQCSTFFEKGPPIRLPRHALHHPSTPLHGTTLPIIVYAPAGISVQAHTYVLICGEAIVSDERGRREKGEL